MTKIKPVNIWQNGENKSCDTINVSIINGNLKSNLTTYYQIGYETEMIDNTPTESKEESEIEEKPKQYSFTSLQDGNVSILGEDYTSLGANGKDVNEYIINFVIKTLNLERA